ncbi:phosphoribosylformylglycinamidine synthase, partial [Alishewanella sp. SMS9]|nr:phosphoribosylformylglycinamidine synthase [Alishewanella sp. SMS9]
ELCPALNVTIPVGKDSMSMKTRWQQDGEEKAVTAPLSLVITAFARVEDIRKTVTPQLRTDLGDSSLLLVDLGQGANRLGGSCLAQVYKQLGDKAEDLDSPELLLNFFHAMQQLTREQKLLAYHDRSDGGLLVTLAEMAFAGKAGLQADISELGADALAALYSEELGAVIQVKTADLAYVQQVLAKHNLAPLSHLLGAVSASDEFVITQQGKTVFSDSRSRLRRIWAETTYQMQALRDNPAGAEQEMAAKADQQDPGLNVKLSFDANVDVAAPFILKGAAPKIAILREQGVNSQQEMAAAFNRAGFNAVDVHMSDILAGRVKLADFNGLAACGGFSYGDVLGAGEGWAKSILFNAQAREQFQAFFERQSTFALGVCNGCQMMSNLKSLIPGAEHWPHFVRNKSERFEARFSLVEVQQSPSLFFSGMAGSRMPIAVSHGEGHAEFASAAAFAAANQSGNVAMRFVDNYGQVTEQYPANPNGSPAGITALTTTDGRVSIMMPHPERVFRTVANSWHPDDWQEDSPWMRMFRNARVWLG